MKKWRMGRKIAYPKTYNVIGKGKHCLYLTNHAGWSLCPFHWYFIIIMEQSGWTGWNRYFFFLLSTEWPSAIVDKKKRFLGRLAEFSMHWVMYNGNLSFVLKSEASWDICSADRTSFAFCLVNTDYDDGENVTNHVCFFASINFLMWRLKVLWTREHSAIN